MLVFASRMFSSSYYLTPRPTPLPLWNCICLSPTYYRIVFLLCVQCLNWTNLNKHFYFGCFQPISKNYLHSWFSRDLKHDSVTLHIVAVANSFEFWSKFCAFLYFLFHISTKYVVMKRLVAGEKQKYESVHSSLNFPSICSDSITPT